MLSKHLGFTSVALEEEFFEFHTQRNQKLETQFHCARALTWFAVLLRALPSREWHACCILALGTVTTLAPAFADRLPRRQYLRWRLPIQVADNLLQVALGVFTHHHIYPNPAVEPSTFQMATVLLTGNGVAWLLFSSLWGSLPFRIALPQQAALTIILLLFNQPLCRHNLGIQYAYARLAHHAASAARSLTPRALVHAWTLWLAPMAISRTCAAAVIAAPESATEAVRAACMQAAVNATAAAGLGTAGNGSAHMGGTPSGSVAAAGAELCLRYQPASLLLLGFVLPTLYIWVTELRLRCAFIAQRWQLAASRAAGASAPAPLPPPEQRRPSEAALRSLGPLPTIEEYCMFCIPALASMYIYVVAQG